MKVWTNQAPIDEDFNRLENTIESIKDSPLSFTEVKSIYNIKTNSVSNNGSDLTIEGVNFSDNLKGEAVYQYPLSATTENARRVTTTGTLYTTPFLYNDNLSIITYGLGAREITGFSNYTGFNICLEAQGIGGSGEYPFCDFLITNITTGYEVRIIYDDDYPIPIGTGYNRFYYNVGLGSIRIKDMVTSFPKTIKARPVTANLRRCKYPIVENAPIKVLSTDYSAYEQRKTTEADFTSFRIS